MITAEEARAIAGPSIENLCEEFDAPIRAAAAQKKRYIQVRHQKLAEAYLGQRYLWTQFAEKMTSFGYTVKIHCPFAGLAGFPDEYRITIAW